ncbi:YhgE/Pip domain-containing protein [Bifidobacterium eulemuris]|uniref:Phage infection protein n=1 Tax=Bifidobacterium eulemuris TaxID=1765219 RepID=A0A261GCT2_9BIFI|nr:YhgE/Pip domain-containing protein [Bifidobacterium eulemuris]OZG68955.1 phage infection protein [Bifidobacterium eulemuris]QOL31510.1 YhgE/Pip domain-containing protein [Bifidobacterium eulemuris]
MRTIWNIIATDVRALCSRTASVLFIIALCVLPSAYSWYNIIACWDPYGNTGNLKVAVSSDDEGYDGELTPMIISIGDNIISSLRGNDDFDWQFVSTDDAIEGVKSGDYYAAIVIPESFSVDMMTMFSDDATHAALNYYVNEKENPLAPTITDSGASSVQTQINDTFETTVADTAFSLISSLSDYADKDSTRNAIASISDGMSSTAADLRQSGETLGTYADAVRSAKALIESSEDLLGSTGTALSEAKDAMNTAGDGSASLQDSLESASSAISTAIAGSAEGYQSAASSVETAYATIDESMADAAQLLRDQASAVDEQISAYQQMRDTLAGLSDLDDATLQSLLGRFDDAIARQQSLSDSLNSAADSVETRREDASANKDEVETLLQQATDSITALQNEYDDTAKSAIDSMSADLSSAIAKGLSASSNLDALDSLSGATGDMTTKLDEIEATISEAQAKLGTAATELEQHSQDIDDALSSGDADTLREVIGTDASVLASALVTPVSLDRHAIFASENFGSSMTPFYAVLAIWVGAFLSTSAIRMSLTEERMEELKRRRHGKPVPSPLLFLGRYGVFMLISLAQTLMACAGIIWFLKAQCEHPALLLLGGAATSILFSAITYTLVAIFGNIGKFFGVLLLILQLNGSSGSMPVELMPQWVQAAYPYLPITHAIRLFRSAMFGIYDNDYWKELGILLAVAALVLAVGVLFSAFGRKLSEGMERMMKGNALLAI